MKGIGCKDKGKRIIMEERRGVRRKAVGEENGRGAWGTAFWRSSRAWLHGLKDFNFNSLIILKCFTLLETRGRLFSTAVAAIIASPDLRPEAIVYCSI